MNNPFSVKTPETLSPKDIADLFIDVFSDFPRIQASEHTFIHGPRGTGKSMMLRYLEPQVQLAAHKVQHANELPHYAVHMPVKSSYYSLSELERLKGAPYWLLAEHFLIANAILHILKSLEKLTELELLEESSRLDFIHKVYTLADNMGCRLSDVKDYSSLTDLYKIFDTERRAAKSYLGKLAFTQELVPYSDALFSYEDVFIPLVKLVKGLSITPAGPLFLMLDDADNLPVRMQQIINGWVSYRSTNTICLKISTQQRYKTWRTTQNILIESSHDFSEVDISSVYTSKHTSHYYDRVEQVVRRRLEIYNISCSPEDFFPINSDQETALEAIKDKIKQSWDNGVRVSSRKSDDITRYTVSEYMKELALSKKTNKYSYAGFKSMVNISSGMIRFFLEPAARMYNEITAKNSEGNITHIPAKIQDDVLYKWSEEFLLEEFDRLKVDEATISSDCESNTKSGIDNKVQRLKSLINGLGELFQAKLISDDSERRLISFMLTSTPKEDVQEVLDLGVEWGYLHRKTIARKEGIGRNTLYSLNRRLSPYFKLDPSGYAAHISITPEDLQLAMYDHRAFTRQRLDKITDKKLNTNQASLNL
ncbi:ORC-CDC6 family AAA ATPase [Shewanella algae]